MHHGKIDRQWQTWVRNVDFAISAGLPPYPLITTEKQTSRHVRKPAQKETHPLQQSRELLIQDDPRAGCAIQQPLEVEAGQLIVSAPANMRGESRHCAGVARF